MTLCDRKIKNIFLIATLILILSILGLLFYTNWFDEDKNNIGDAQTQPKTKEQATVIEEDSKKEAYPFASDPIGTAFFGKITGNFQLLVTRSSGIAHQTRSNICEPIRIVR